MSINTVSKLLVEAGEACLAIHDKLVHKVEAKRIQCDEIQVSLFVLSFPTRSCCLLRNLGSPLRRHVLGALLPALPAKLGGGARKLAILFNLASGGLGDHESAANHIGGALLSAWPLRQHSSPPTSAPILQCAALSRHGDRE